MWFPGKGKTRGIQPSESDNRFTVQSGSFCNWPPLIPVSVAVPTLKMGKKKKKTLIQFKIMNWKPYIRQAAEGLPLLDLPFSLVPLISKG